MKDLIWRNYRKSNVKLGLEWRNYKHCFIVDIISESLVPSLLVAKNEIIVLLFLAMKATFRL